MRLVGVTAGALFFLGSCVAASGAQTASAGIKGTVYDSVHAAPVVGATVLAIAASPSGSPQINQAKTDTHGAFEMRALAPGRYTISVESGALDSAGLSIADRERTLAAGSQIELPLATPSRASRVRLACGGPIADTTLGAIIGVVRDAASGRPVPGASLVLQWSDFSVDKVAHYHSQSRIASVVADSTGAYRACGVPAARSIFLQAQLRTRNTGIIQDIVNESGVLVRDFALGADSTPTGRGSVTVLVLDIDGHPLRDAQVVLIGTTRRVEVGDDGRGRLDSLPAGTQQLEVIAIGYYPVRQTVDLATETPRSLTISMEHLATVLDSMRIVASISASNPRYREFESRRKQGWGDFYGESDIAKRNIFDLSDFFMILPHINAHVSGGGQHYFTTREWRGISTIMPRSQPLVPIPGGGVFSDTMPVRQPPSPIAGIGGSGSPGSACQPVIVINGTPVPNDEANYVLAAMPPTAVHGIEVYGAHDPVPVQYRYFAGGECGAIIIWLK